MPSFLIFISRSFTPFDFCFFISFNIRAPIRYLQPVCAPQLWYKFYRDHYLLCILNREHQYQSDILNWAFVLNVKCRTLFTSSKRNTPTHIYTVWIQNSKLGLYFKQLDGKRERERMRSVPIWVKSFCKVSFSFSFRVGNKKKCLGPFAQWLTTKSPQSFLFSWMDGEYVI